MCQLQMYYLITNFHSLTSQNIGEKLQNMLCILIRLDRETANSGCIIIFQCYIGYKTEDRRHNINYNCIEEGEVDGTIAAQRTTKIEGLHFGQYLLNPWLHWTGATEVSRVGSLCASQSRPFESGPSFTVSRMVLAYRSVDRKKGIAVPKSPRTSAFITRLTLLRRIDPEHIALQTLTRSTQRPRTKCNRNDRVLRIVLVGDLNVIWDSAAKGADSAEEVHLLGMRRPDVIVEEGRRGCCRFSVHRFCYISNV